MTEVRSVTRVPPLRDAGIVEIAAEPGEMPDAYAYGTYRDLLFLLDRYQRAWVPGESDRMRIRIRHSRANDAEDDIGWIPLASLLETVGGRGVAAYILSRGFTTHLQPIVQADGSVAGYECLLRPLPEQTPFRPAELFDKAQRIGQHTFLDREARHAAIRVSAAHLPPGTKRFVNFLPSSLYGPDAGLQHTMGAIRETGTDPGDVVFEVVETETLDHPDLPRIFEDYRRQGVRMAVDDVGSGYATVDAVERLQPDYVKLDRKWISGCERDARRQRHIDDALARAARFGGTVLAEGVERAEEWDYLRRAGIPLFQGYLFGRAAPVPAYETPAVLR